MDKVKDKFMDMFKMDKTSDRIQNLPLNSIETLQTVKQMRELCQELQRIGSFGLCTYSISNNEEDKKSKKKSLQGLSELFDENYSSLPQNDPSRGPLLACKKTFLDEYKLAISMRYNLESQVIAPLAELEKTCSKIQEIHRRINQLSRDLETATERLNKINPENCDENKKQSAIDSMLEVQNQLDNEMDLFMMKMLQFESRSYDHAGILNEMIILRSDYHDKCKKAWNDMLPDCQKIMEENRKPVSFGTPLETHLRETKRILAYPLEFCIQVLSKNLQQEGLFRVSGSLNKTDLLCEILNSMKYTEETKSMQANVVADALKRYLRQMPVQLLGKISFDQWEKCFEKHQSGYTHQAQWMILELIESLPPSYHHNAEYLIRFLCQVSQYKAKNLMSTANLCTVFVPNLFRQHLNDLQAMNMESSNCLRFVLESLLEDPDFFFPHSNNVDKKNIVPQRRKMRLADKRKSQETMIQSLEVERARNIVRTSKEENRRAIYINDLLVGIDPSVTHESNSPIQNKSPSSKSPAVRHKTTIVEYLPTPSNHNFQSISRVNIPSITHDLAGGGGCGGHSNQVLAELNNNTSTSSNQSNYNQKNTAHSLVNPCYNNQLLVPHDDDRSASYISIRDVISPVSSINISYMSSPCPSPDIPPTIPTSIDRSLPSYNPSAPPRLKRKT